MTDFSLEAVKILRAAEDALSGRRPAAAALDAAASPESASILEMHRQLRVALSEISALRGELALEREARAQTLTALGRRWREEVLVEVRTADHETRRAVSELESSVGQRLQEAAAARQVMRRQLDEAVRAGKHHDRSRFDQQEQMDEALAELRARLEAALQECAAGRLESARLVERERGALDRRLDAALVQFAEDRRAEERQRAVRREERAAAALSHTRAAAEAAEAAWAKRGAVLERAVDECAQSGRRETARLAERVGVAEAKAAEALLQSRSAAALAERVCAAEVSAAAAAQRADRAERRAEAAETAAREAAETCRLRPPPLDADRAERLVAEVAAASRAASRAEKGVAALREASGRAEAEGERLRRAEADVRRLQETVAQPCPAAERFGREAKAALDEETRARAALAGRWEAWGAQWEKSRRDERRELQCACEAQRAETDECRRRLDALGAELRSLAQRGAAETAADGAIRGELDAVRRAVSHLEAQLRTAAAETDTRVEDGVARAESMAAAQLEGLRKELRKELGEELQKELRKDLQKELGEDFREDLRNELQKELGEELQKELGEELRKELGEELRKDLGEELQKELRKDLQKELGEDFREDLRNELRNELQKELGEELREELGEELQKELQKELRKELGEDFREDLRNELGKELQKELQKELRKELGEDFREDLRNELGKELQKELGEELREELGEELRKELREDLRQLQSAVDALRLAHRSAHTTPRTNPQTSSTEVVARDDRSSPSARPGSGGDTPSQRTSGSSHGPHRSQSARRPSRMQPLPESSSSSASAEKRLPPRGPLGTETSAETPGRALRESAVTPPSGKPNAAWYNDWDDTTESGSAPPSPAPPQAVEVQPEKMGIYTTPRRAFVAMEGEEREKEAEETVPRHGVATSSASSGGSHEKKRPPPQTTKGYTAFDDTTSEEDA